MGSDGREKVDERIDASEAHETDQGNEVRVGEIIYGWEEKKKRKKKII